MSWYRLIDLLDDEEYPKEKGDYFGTEIALLIGVSRFEGKNRNRNSFEILEYTTFCRSYDKPIGRYTLAEFLGEHKELQRCY